MKRPTGSGSERVAGDAVELGAEGGEVLVAGGDGRDVDEDDAGAVGVAVLELADHGAGKVAAGRGLEKVAPGSQEVLGGDGRGEEAVVDGDGVFFGAEVGGVEPDVLDAGVGGESGGVSGEGDGLLRVGEQDVAGFGGGAVAEQLEQALGVDGLVPGVALGLEAVGRELDEEDARAGVVGEVAIEGEVVGDREDRVGDGDVAGFEAGIALDDVGVDAGHGGGVAEDQDVAVAVAHGEDGVVGLDPDAGAVAQEEVGAAQADAGRDGQKREEKEEDAVEAGRLWRRHRRRGNRARGVILLALEDGGKCQVWSLNSCIEQVPCV